MDETMIAKLQELPESLAEEASDFIDFLKIKRNPDLWQAWLLFSEQVTLSEAGLSTYLQDLQDYEDRLARGEVQW